MMLFISELWNFFHRENKVLPYGEWLQGALYIIKNLKCAFKNEKKRKKIKKKKKGKNVQNLPLLV